MGKKEVKLHILRGKGDLNFASYSDSQTCTYITVISGASEEWRFLIPTADIGNLKLQSGNLVSAFEKNPTHDQYKSSGLDIIVKKYFHSSSFKNLAFTYEEVYFYHLHFLYTIDFILIYIQTVITCFCVTIIYTF